MTVAYKDTDYHRHICPRMCYRERPEVVLEDGVRLLPLGEVAVVLAEFEPYEIVPGWPDADAFEVYKELRSEGVSHSDARDLLIA